MGEMSGCEWEKFLNPALPTIQTHGVFSLPTRKLVLP